MELEQTFVISLNEFFVDVEENLKNDEIKKVKNVMETMTINDKVKCFLNLKSHERDIFNIMLGKKSDYTIFKDVHLSTPEFSIDQLFNEQTQETCKTLMKYLYNLYVLAVLIDNVNKGIDNPSFRYLVEQVKEKQKEIVPVNGLGSLGGIMDLMNNPEIQGMVNSFGQKMQSGELNMGSLLQGLMSGNLESNPIISEMTRTLERKSKNGEINIEKIHTEFQNSPFANLISQQTAPIVTIPVPELTPTNTTTTTTKKKNKNKKK
jgi:hypothetical protein